MQSNKTIAIYCRTALKQGVTHAIEHQKKTTIEVAATIGYQKLLVLEDTGFSGSTFNRPGFIKLEHMITQGKVDTLIAEDVSRIGRNSIEVMRWIWEMSQYGIDFHFLNQPNLLPTELYTDTLLAAAMKGGEDV